MDKLGRYGFTQRTTLLLVLLTVLSLSGILLMPKDAEASCCGQVSITICYFDAAKTQYAGECWQDGCEGTSGCSGTITSYVTHRLNCCCYSWW